MVLLSSSVRFFAFSVSFCAPNMATTVLVPCCCTILVEIRDSKCTRAWVMLWIFSESVFPGSFSALITILYLFLPYSIRQSVGDLLKDSLIGFLFCGILVL